MPIYYFRGTARLKSLIGCLCAMTPGGRQYVALFVRWVGGDREPFLEPKATHTLEGIYRPALTVAIRRKRLVDDTADWTTVHGEAYQHRDMLNESLCHEYVTVIYKPLTQI